MQLLKFIYYFNFILIFYLYIYIFIFLYLFQDISEGLFKFQLGGQKHWNVYTKSFLQFGHVSARVRHVTGIAQEAIALHHSSKHGHHRHMKRRKLNTISTSSTNHQNDFILRHLPNTTFAIKKSPSSSSSSSSFSSISSLTQQQLQQQLQQQQQQQQQPLQSQQQDPQSYHHEKNEDDDNNIHAINYCFFAGYDEKIRPSSPDPYEVDIPYQDKQVLLFGPDEPYNDQFLLCLDMLRPLLVKYNNNYCNIGEIDDKFIIMIMIVIINCHNYHLMRSHLLLSY